MSHVDGGLKLIIERMRADLRRSGLDEPGVLKKMGVRPVRSSEAQELYGVRRDGYSLPYFDLEGKVRPDHFHRIRWLDGGKTIDPHGKYFQMPGTPPALYFPPFGDWKSIAESPLSPIWITEGEKKSAAATAIGTATIGLGGVWSWKAKQFDFGVLPEFGWIAWAGREVTIAFDSDVARKPQVKQAMHALALMLTGLGARVFIATLEDSRGGKNCGLDDLIVAKGQDALFRVPRMAFGPCEELWQFNDRYAMIAELDAGVLDLATISEDARAPHVYTRPAFQALHAAKRFSMPSADGGQSKPKQLTEAWLTWQERLTYRRIIFAPGKMQRLDHDLNLWRACQIKPRKPKVRSALDPYLRLRDHLFTHEQMLIPWFEAWTAAPLVTPGLKHRTALMIHGQKQGTGKTLMGNLLGALYGGPPHFVTLDGKKLLDRFNPWALRALFVLGDELVPDDKRQFADQIKPYITGDTVSSEQKYLPSITVTNHMNFFFTSNHPNALYLSTDDRRFTIVATPPVVLEQDLYRTLYAWARGDVPEALEWLLWYMLEVVDLKACDPNAHAPNTKSKDTMADASLSGIQRWVAELLTAPDDVLVAPDGSPLPGGLWKAGDLALVLDSAASARDRHSLATSIGVALHERGVPTLKLLNYSGAQFFVLRDPDVWQHAEPIAAWRHYCLTRRGEAPAPVAVPTPPLRSTKKTRIKRGTTTARVVRLKKSKEG